MYVCIVCVYVCMYVCMCMYGCMCVCMCVCMYVCMYMYVKKLINLWSIKTVNNGCTVDFSIDFECKSMILNNTIGLFFPIAVNKIMNAFETRALYISQENKVGVIK